MEVLTTMNFFKKKNPKSEFGNCFLCSARLDENYGSLSYVSESKDVEYAKICSTCADVLDRLDKQDPIETEDYDDDESF